MADIITNTLQIGSNNLILRDADAQEQITDLKEETRNLFDIKTLPIKAGITLTDRGLTGTSTAFANGYGNSTNGISNDISFENDTQYTFSCKAMYEPVGSQHGLIIRFIYSDATQSQAVIDATYTAFKQFELTSDANKTISKIVVSYASGGTDVWYLKDLQIEKGITATNYITHVTALDAVARQTILDSVQEITLETESLTDTTNAVSNIVSMLDNGKAVFDYTLFERGTYYTSSAPNYNYMVRTQNAVSFDRKIVATAKTGYKLKMLDNPRTHDTGWVDSVTLEPNTEYFLSIRQEPVDNMIIANIAEFVSNITFETYDRSAIKMLSDRVDDIDSNAEAEAIQWNDTYHANGRLIKCYNPYKEQKSLSLCGQLHCHTRDMTTGLYYDGTSTAETTLAKYRSLGYDFMTITDYGNTSGGITKPSASDIPSGLVWLFDSQEVRIDTKSDSDNPAVHICTYNSKSPITGLKGISVQEYIDDYKKDGLMMSLAHPFSPSLNVTFADLDKIKTRLRFVEVFNGLSAAQDEEGTYPYVIPTGYGTDFAWQRLLDNGNAVWGVAVSDAHTISVDWRMTYGCVYVFADNNNPEEILRNLCCGNFVATEALNYKIEQPTFANGVYSVETGDDSAITVFYKENSEVVKTVTGRTATYTMTGNEKYVRAIVTKGSNNRKIWVQPIINVFSEDYDNYSDFIKL